MRYLGLGFAITCIGSVWAADLPKDLSYHGQPIDALCFSNLGSKDAYKINLSTCGMRAQKYQLDTKNDYMLKKGFIGYDWKEGSDNFSAHGYSYYKYFNAGQGYFWIYSVNGTGGTGSFSQLKLVKRVSDDKFSVKELVGGDRCNGGLSNVVSQANGNLEVSINVTPYDIYHMGTDSAKLKAYDDLAACAVCGAGQAKYTIGKNKSMVFDSVELNAVKDINELSDQGRYQQCFNKLHMAYNQKNQLKLTPAELKTFVKQFNQNCHP